MGRRRRAANEAKHIRAKPLGFPRNVQLEDRYVRRGSEMTDEDVCCSRSPPCLQDLLRSAPRADCFAFQLGPFVPPRTLKIHGKPRRRSSHRFASGDGRLNPLLKY